MDKLGQEWVSAAVDGELDEQTLAELAADADSHEQWRDYHMIGDAMRGELPQAVSIDLSDSIMAAIDEEPAIIAPKQTTVKAATKPTSSKVFSLVCISNKILLATSVSYLFKLIFSKKAFNFSIESINNSSILLLSIFTY